LIKQYKQKQSKAKQKQSKDCACETPLAEIFFFPDNGARKSALCGQITTHLGTPRGRYDEHSSKSPLSKKPRFIEPVGKRQTSEGDSC
jgi:hypothetical protein